MRQNLKTFAFMQPLILTQPQGPAWVGDKWAPYLDFLDSLVVRCVGKVYGVDWRELE